MVISWLADWKNSAALTRLSSATDAAGAKAMVRPAARIASLRVRALSGDSFQKSGTRASKKISRRMAKAPDHAKGTLPGPNKPAMGAFHTLRISDQKSGGSGRYQ